MRFEVHIQWQRLANLLAEARESRAEIEQLRMAVGLAATFKPTMPMRPEYPVQMMMEVAEYLAASQEREKRLREMLKQQSTDTILIDDKWIEAALAKE